MVHTNTLLYHGREVFGFHTPDNIAEQIAHGEFLMRICEKEMTEEVHIGRQSYSRLSWQKNMHFCN
jgi:hypothetical protein